MYLGCRRSGPMSAKGVLLCLITRSMVALSLSLRREARAQCGKGLELYIEHCALVICGRSSASVPYMYGVCEKDNQTTSRNFSLEVRSVKNRPVASAFMGSWLDN